MSKRMIDSELIEALGTDIKFDGTGNVIVGKNLEVGGTTKLSGGLEILYSYDFKDNISTRLDVVFARHNHFSGTWDEYIGYGYISQFGTRHPCIFSYSTNNGAIETFNAISEYKIYTLENKQVAGYEIAKSGQCQSKLYRHKITLNGIYVLMYDSASNLSVGSVADLRTIMKISSESEEILPVCASDATSMVTLVVTDSLCQVDGTDVTTVSDTVKPL